MRVPVRRDGRECRRALHGAGARPGPPNGAGAVCEGQGGAGDRGQRRSGALPAAAHGAEGGGGPGVGADRLGGGARHGRRAAWEDRRGVGAGVGRVRVRVAVDLGDQRSVDWITRLRRAFGSPNFCLLDGAVRMGSVSRLDVHVRRAGAGGIHARPRAGRLHPLLGVQPLGRAARPRHRDGRRTPAGGEAGGDRPAPRGARVERRPLAAGAPWDRRRARARDHRRAARPRAVSTSSSSGA